jgi:MHS family proline/betaine transporter-like MFS transporter
MPTTPTSPRRVRTVVAGMIGNVLEWYDFALFGFMAPILSPLFFPAEDRLASLLATYGVFAVGFLMRPIGGIFFGHIGDRFGRKRALEWSVLLMAVSTTLLGLLPTHAQVGLIAPLLLTLMRMAQGFSVGGEFIGSISFLGEHAPAERRGFFSSCSATSASLGSLLGSGVAALTQYVVPSEDMATWGWRAPFVCSVALGVLGMWIRSGVAESPQFQQAAGKGEVLRAPLTVALRENRAAVAITAGLALMFSVGCYLPWVWLPTWMATMRPNPIPLAEALTINTIAMAVLLLAQPAFGALSDRVGRRPVMIAGCVALAVCVYPLFVVLSSEGEWDDLAALIAIAIFASMVTGVAPAAFVELFPTHTRYSGIAIGYNGTQAALGGTTPFIATWLVDMTGDARAPAFFLLAATALCGVAAYSMTERAGQPLE